MKSTSLKHMVDEFSKFATHADSADVDGSLDDVINEVTTLYQGPTRMWN